MFDFSDCPQHSEFFDPANKKVVGKMKDELKEKMISDVIGLKSKMYSLTEVKKAKRVNRNVVKKIRHKEYIDVV